MFERKFKIKLEDYCESLSYSKGAEKYSTTTKN